MSHLVGNPEDRFSHDAAQTTVGPVRKFLPLSIFFSFHVGIIIILLKTVTTGASLRMLIMKYIQTINAVV